MEEKSILATHTGEFYQPVRLHYQVLDPPGLRADFRKLRCLEFDSSRKRWVWLYDHEAKGLQFKKSRGDISARLQPIVIGSIWLHGQAVMHLDLRSCERAIAAVSFFDRHIPRNVAKVTEAEVVNRLFAVEEANLAPEILFDRANTPPWDQDKAEERLKAIQEKALQSADSQERLDIALEEMQAHSKQPLPEVERLPIHLYEDGPDGFILALRLRQIVALEHWLGNTNFGMFDAMQMLFERPKVGDGSSK